MELGSCSASVLDADRRSNPLTLLGSKESRFHAGQHRGSLPSEEAATKPLFLAIRNAGIRWRRPIEWTAAMGQFAILFEDRFPASAR